MGRRHNAQSGFKTRSRTCRHGRLGVMDAVALITIVGLTVAITTVRIRWAKTRTKAGREIKLLEQATREAKSSERASRSSARLSNASVEVSNSSLRYLAAAEQARQSDRLLAWVCLCLYRRWLLLYSGWLVGRATQLRNKAKAKLQRCNSIFDSLGIKHDSNREDGM